jgi:putative copper export protein
MRGVDVETLRLFLHVLAATVWVGGQITLAALVPALRAAGADVPRAAANAFNRIAWPAFGVLLLTGIWNVVAEGDKGPAYERTLMLKYTLVVASGVTAYVHARARSRRTMAVFGALTGLIGDGARRV